MKTCLVVDDSRTMRKIVTHMMSSLGFSCREAENGEEARNSCVSDMPDLIMLDWNMPVMTGIDFLRILRGMKNGGKPQVIFCTTESDYSFIEQAMQAGGNEYVMKPFDRSIIQSKLEQLGLIKGQGL